MVRKTSNTNSRLRWLVTALVAVIILYAICSRVFHVWPFRAAPASHVATTKTTSKAPSAQSNFTSGGGKNDNKTPEPSSNNSGTDTGGSQPASASDSSSWSKSSDGSSIVVMGPAQNSLFVSGDTLYGTSTASTVSYELEDDVSGMILQGQADVVNGQFSVKLTFSTSGASGRINVFNQAADGTEHNNVSISVKFK